jgi:hypothetical protein
MGGEETIMFGDSPTGRWQRVAAYAVVIVLGLLGLALLWLAHL